MKFAEMVQVNKRLFCNQSVTMSSKRKRVGKKKEERHSSKLDCSRIDASSQLVETAVADAELAPLDEASETTFARHLRWYAFRMSQHLSKLKGEEKITPKMVDEADKFAKAVPIGQKWDSLNTILLNPRNPEGIEVSVGMSVPRQHVNYRFDSPNKAFSVGLELISAAISWDAQHVMLSRTRESSITGKTVVVEDDKDDTRSGYEEAILNLMKDELACLDDELAYCVQELHYEKDRKEASTSDEDEERSL